MQQSQFERLLKLAQRTGDRLIVTDPSGKEPVVILPLAEYEGLLDHDSFRGRGEDRHEQERSHENVRQPQFAGEEVNVDVIETEGEFDPEALEEQVMAAMLVDEPEVVPVPVMSSLSSAETDETGETEQESAARIEEAPRKPIVRRAKPEGEEQFYLEPV